jgi:hypothetical protein
MNELQYRLVGFAIGMMLIFSFFSCEKDFDDYSNNTNHILSFSTDTLSFDTILSTIGTSTHRFMVYNKNDKPLNISSIALDSEGKSGFRMNVDGLKGTLIQNVEIGAKDSLYVFVEATLSENEENSPIKINDYITFTTNTVQQKVVLEAYGQDVFIWRGKIIEEDMILAQEKPYLIYDSLLIKEGVELTIPEGTVFYLHDKAEIKVYGTIKAKGTIHNRIIFRGDRPDYLFSALPYDRIPRQWGGIYIAPESYDNELEYIEIRNGTYGIFCEEAQPERLKLKMKNSVLKNSYSSLFSSVNCWIEAENCEISNAGEALLYLVGGKYEFTHCTMANYMNWGSYFNNWTTQGKTLILTNYQTDSVGKKIYFPLEKADFYNSIIYGNRYRASYVTIPDTINSTFNYQFQNCLLYADSAKIYKNTTKCIFNKEPVFLNINRNPDQTLRPEFIFDYRPDSVSPARNAADPFISAQLPADINGISRFTDDKPDIGAYEWVPQNE